MEILGGYCWQGSNIMEDILVPTKSLDMLLVETGIKNSHGHILENNVISIIWTLNSKRLQSIMSVEILG